MEEKADGSSKRRRPHDSTKIDERSVIPDWASLLPELIQEEEDNGTDMMKLVNFKCNIYCADPGGCVMEFVAPADLVVIAKVSPDVHVHAEGDHSRLRSYLVESAGQLLLIRFENQTLNVFRVNVEHKLLEKIDSLGGRALFLGEERCVSVDADKLPSVEEDCIYFSDFEEEGDMWVYNLRVDTVNIISSEDNID